MLTWMLAVAPPVVFRLTFFEGFLVGEPACVFTDAFATLALMFALRLAEEQELL